MTPTDTAIFITAAIAAELPVEITYQAADGNVTRRVIDPYELADTRDGHQIVRAVDHARRNWRTFRITRIFDIHTCGQTRIPRPGSDHPDATLPAETAREAAALTRIRAELRTVIWSGEGPDAARWTPDMADQN